MKKEIEKILAGHVERLCVKLKENYVDTPFPFLKDKSGKKGTNFLYDLNIIKFKDVNGCDISRI